MTLTVNGDPHTIDDGATVERLLDALGLGGRPCAVEVNRSLVPKRDHAGHTLADNDTVEVVTLVGGG